MGEARHAHLGVSHRGGEVAVNRTEVTLSVHQHVAHGERLRHTDHGVIDRRITVRVVLTDDVTDDTGRLLVGLIPVDAQLVHRVEHAPMHRLETVPNVRECTADDDAHGVVEVRLPHLVFEVDVQDFACDLGHIGNARKG